MNIKNKYFLIYQIKLKVFSWWFCFWNDQIHRNTSKDCQQNSVWLCFWSSAIYPSCPPHGNRENLWWRDGWWPQLFRLSSCWLVSHCLKTTRTMIKTDRPATVCVRLSFECHCCCCCYQFGEGVATGQKEPVNSLLGWSVGQCCGCTSPATSAAARPSTGNIDRCTVATVLLNCQRNTCVCIIYKNIYQ